MEISERKHVRSLFLSDFHMGAKSFDSRALLSFLQSYEADYIYLVGDIVDGWKLRKRWYWDSYCTAIFDELARKASHGTVITYLPGNHDERVRRLTSPERKAFAAKIGIRIQNKIIHRTADGRRFLVMHGDQFDRRIIRGPLSRWSDWTYDLLLELLPPARPERIVIEGQDKKFSLAKALQSSGQRALSLINNLESAIYRAVKRRNLEGLICGHTHIPVIKTIRDVTYANCGAWLRTGHTALAEREDGTLVLIDWPSSDSETSALLPPPPDRPASAVSRFILQNIKTLWPVKSGRKPKNLNFRVEKCL